MKGVAWFICLALLTIGFLFIRGCVVAHWEYEKDISAPWELSRKASTIPQKAKLIDQFISNLEKSNLNETYDAVWMITPDNSFNPNMEQLKTLQIRLHEIEKMDPASF